MKALKKLVVAVAVAGACGNAVASPFWFDADGGGAGAAVKIVDGFDFIGSLGVDFDFNNATPSPLDFSFNQWAAANVLGADGYQTTFGPGITATLVGTGVGVLGTSPANPGFISFTGGTITLSNQGYNNPFATFNITHGGAAVGTNAFPNGNTNTFADIVSASVGYLFADANGSIGVDFNDLPQDQWDTTFMFVGTTLTQVASRYSAISAAFPNAPLAQQTTFDPVQFGGRPDFVYYSANGSDYITVPEPGSLALAGLGLLGLGALRRRKSEKAA